MVATNVYVDNISFLEGSGVWDSVTNYFVNRGAATSWEFIIVQRRRISIILNKIIMNHLINFFSCYPWRNNPVRCINPSSRNFTRCSRLGDFFFRMNIYRFISQILETPIRRRSLCIIWFLNTIRHSSMSDKTIRMWSHRSSIPKT